MLTKDKIREVLEELDILEINMSGTTGKKLGMCAATLHRVKTLGLLKVSEGTIHKDDLVRWLMLDARSCARVFARAAAQRKTMEA